MNFSRYLIRKSIAQIQSESQSGSLKRSLGPWNLVSLGIGCIIGAGIFVLTGKAAAAHAGPAIVLSFVLAGMACAFAAFCYAELASVLPVSGSAYTYAYATLGEVFAWTMGWLLILEYGLASATVAVGWSGYINSILMDFGVLLPPEWVNPIGQKVQIAETLRQFYEARGYTLVQECPPTNLINGVCEQGKAINFLANGSGQLIHGLFNLPAFLGVLAVSGLLVLGIKESANVNNVIVAIKLVVVVLFIAVGVFHIDVANWTPFIPEPTGLPGQYGFDGVLKAAGVIFFAYIGFEAVSTAAQEAKNPQRDMPIGILGSLFICTILYMAVSGILTGIVHYSQLNVPDPMAVAVNKIGIGWLSFLIKVGAITGLTSVMLVLVYGQTRIFYTMSKDGLIPGIFSTVHKKFQTPYINTLMVGFVVAVAAATTPISKLGDLVSMGTLFAFCIVCFSVLYLRKKQPDLPRPFRVPGGPIIPVLGIIFCGYLMYGIGVEVFIQLKVYFILGIVVYFLYSQFHSKLHKDGGAS